MNLKLINLERKMSNVDWFYTVMSLGLSWVVLSFPYLVEKAVKLFK
jgi:hypothetical protein